MWTACSPGGRFLRSSLILMPFFASFKVAVPTLSPLAFFNSTVVDLPAACNRELPSSNVNGTMSNFVCFMLADYSLWSADCGRRCARRSAAERGCSRAAFHGSVSIVKDSPQQPAVLQQSLPDPFHGGTEAACQCEFGSFRARRI